MSHKKKCKCGFCEMIKKRQAAGKKQFLGVRLSAETMDKIREKCQAKNCTPGKLIEALFRNT